MFVCLDFVMIVYYIRIYYVLVACMLISREANLTSSTLN